MTDKTEADLKANHLAMLAEIEPCIEQLRSYVDDGTKLDYSIDSLNYIDVIVATQRNLIPRGTKSPTGEIISQTDEETWLITRLGYYLGEVLNRNMEMAWQLELGDKKNALYGETIVKGENVAGGINPLRVSFNIWHDHGGPSKGFADYYKKISSQNEQ